MFKRFLKTLPAILLFVGVVGVYNADAAVQLVSRKIGQDETPINRVPMIDGAGSDNLGVDTIANAEADTSSASYNFLAADLVRLYTWGRQETANDTVFVQAIVYSPFDSVVTNVALDSIIGDAGHESKDITSLVNIYGRVRIRLLGANSSGEDTTSVLLGIEETYEGGS